MKKAPLSDIKIWYIFRPTFSIWVSKMKGKTFFTSMLDEPYYGSDSEFNTGYFWFCNTYKTKMVENKRINII